MFWSKKKSPAESSWNTLDMWLLMTEEQFKAHYEYDRARYLAVYKPFETETAEVKRLREVWDWIRKIYEIRETLMMHGWLPPREKDAAARDGKKVTKWSFDRSYRRDELPALARDYFPAEHSKEA